MNRYACGVPTNECIGSLAPVKRPLALPMAHGTREEAFRCMVASLKRRGYTRIGGREYAPPDGGPILVLAKKIRFGGRLRRGKSAEGGKTKRVMPERGGGIIY